MVRLDKVSEANQWELDGNCSVCKRQKYCLRHCIAHIDAVNYKYRELEPEQDEGGD